MDVSETFYAAENFIKHGFGAQLLVGDGASPETFEAVVLVRKITPGNGSVADVPRTHLRSQNNHAEHGAGLLDDAAWTVDLMWAPTHESQSLTGGGSGSFTAGGLRYIYTNRLIKNYKLELNDGVGSPDDRTYIIVRAYISSWQWGEVNETNDIPLTIGLMPSIAPVPSV